MRDKDVLAAAVLEDACLTLEELASACAVDPEWVIRHVEEGILRTAGGSVVEWRFTSRDLARARHVYTLERDFDAVPELAGLVADLLDEVDRLRARMRRSGLA
jgi:chaperone modulatory protein CbpM